MKSHSQPQPQPASGFTLVELLCVMAIIGLLAALLLPALALGKDRAKRLVCLNNEREQGLAFHMFLHDHDGKFPMAVPMSDGGTEEFAEDGQTLGGQFYFSYRHFQVLSNYSAVPRELVCPADNREPAANMGLLNNNHLSFFVGINADYNTPESILAGDRNISVQTSETPTIQLFAPGSRLRWTQELHRYKGDVLFADGHVELWNQLTLTADLRGRKQQGEFFLPSISRPSQVWNNNPNRPAPAPHSVNEANPGDGTAVSPTSLPPADRAKASSTGSRPVIPDPLATVATTATVMVSGSDSTAEVSLSADRGHDPASSGETGTGGAGGYFQAFIKSGWWFWLCLFLALGLAETWRRVLKNKSDAIKED